MKPEQDSYLICQDSFSFSSTKFISDHCVTSDVIIKGMSSQIPIVQPKLLL